MFAPVMFGSAPSRLVPRGWRSWKKFMRDAALVLWLMMLAGLLLVARQPREDAMDVRGNSEESVFDSTVMKPQNREKVDYKRQSPKLFQIEKLSHKMASAYPATFLNSMMPEAFPYNRMQPHRVGRPDIEHMSEEQLLDYVLESFNIPTVNCKRMIRIGGSYCAKRMEAEKVVCFDEDKRPYIDDCLVYSFGVGHEMSFDIAIASYGCRVFSFDSDYNHMHYAREIFPDLTFLKIRLGWTRVVNILTDPSGRFPFVYRPLDDIQLNLGHKDVVIDILKIDIENSEWDVFEKSLFDTKILERTRQLAWEVHLDYLYPATPLGLHPDGMEEGLRQHARVVRGLHDRGFELAYYEPNYNVPVNYTRSGRTFHIYFETVWLNTRPWTGQPTEKLPDLTDFDKLPDVEVIHNNI